MIYSFGHSTLDVEDARRVLDGIDVLIDIRSHPTSKFPHWELPQLERWVPETKLAYTWMPELGGWDVRHAPLTDVMAAHGMDITPYTQGYFPKGRISKRLKLDEPAWTVAGFWDYQWFMTLPEFDLGARALSKLGRSKDIAIMCAELIPWSCHRSMVADYLLHFYQTDVTHLQPKRTAHSIWKSRMDRYEPEALILMRENVRSS